MILDIIEEERIFNNDAISLLLEEVEVILVGEKCAIQQMDSDIPCKLIGISVFTQNSENYIVTEGREARKTVKNNRRDLMSELKGILAIEAKIINHPLEIIIDSERFREIRRGECQSTYEFKIQTNSGAIVFMITKMIAYSELKKGMFVIFITSEVELSRFLRNI